MALTLGLAGPGAAFRQDLSPMVGYQVGANFWQGLTVSGGGQLMFNVVRQERIRFYLQGGIAATLYSLSGTHAVATPGLGVGVSGDWGDRFGWFCDLSELWGIDEAGIGSLTLIPIPQAGILYRL